MEARAYLEQIKNIEKRIEAKKAEAQQWEEMAMSCTAGGESTLVFRKGKKEPVLEKMERVQSSGGNKQRMADAAGNAVDLLREAQNAIEELKRTKAEIIAVIEKLENPLHYAIIHKHYVEHKTLVVISQEENYSYAWIVEVHNIALKEIQKILNNL